MRERSGGHWMEEMDELAAKLPTIFDYLDKEWGEATRAYLASERRNGMQAVLGSTKPAPVDAAAQLT